MSDIAIAVREGADAVMLSGETAYGKFPFKAVEVMSTVAHRTESSMLRFSVRTPRSLHCHFFPWLTFMHAVHERAWIAWHCQPLPFPIVMHTIPGVAAVPASWHCLGSRSVPREFSNVSVPAAFSAQA